MKLTFIALILLLFPEFLLSQIREGNDFVRYIKNDTTQKATVADFDSYFVIKDYYIEKEKYTRYDYDQSGKLKRKITFNNKKLDTYTPNKEITEYYENGNKKIVNETYLNNQNDFQIKIIQFWDKENVQKIVNGNGEFIEDNENTFVQGKVSNGLKERIWIENDKKNKISYSELYKNGKFISGTSKTQENKKYSYSLLDEDPKPKKGFDDFNKYVHEKFFSLNSTRMKEVTGSIYIDLNVEFIVETTGKITNIKVFKENSSLCQDLTAAITSYKNWKPGSHRGIPVKTKYSATMYVGMAFYGDSDFFLTKACFEK